MLKFFKYKYGERGYMRIKNRLYNNTLYIMLCGELDEYSADYKSAALPLSHTSINIWCRGAESNHRHRDFQSLALPTELPRQIGDSDGDRTHDL